MPKALKSEGARFTLMAAHTITAAEALTTAAEGVFTTFIGVKSLVLHAKLTYGSGGTTAKAYVQTSADGGTTWHDIACFAFTTATLAKIAALSMSVAAAAPATVTDGTLADNTIANGILGDRFRVRYVTTGTYAGGTTLEVKAIAKA